MKRILTIITGFVLAGMGCQGGYEPSTPEELALRARSSRDAARQLEDALMHLSNDATQSKRRSLLAFQSRQPGPRSAALQLIASDFACRTELLRRHYPTVFEMLAILEALPICDTATAVIVDELVILTVFGDSPGSTATK